MRVTVVGGGSWGSVFSALLAAGEHEVTLACRKPEQARAIARTGRNPRYLTGVALDRVRATTIDRAPASGADLVVVAVPSRAFAEVAAALPSGPPVLILTKGLDPATGRRLSELLARRPVAVLSGPNHAEEIAQGLPAATVVASDDLELARRLQAEINSPVFRVYVNDDVAGVELAAAAKNVVAVAAGAVDGLRLGDNAKASLISRGLAEMARLGAVSGARQETFFGLAGLGDLVVTCWSRHSRNRRGGELLAGGSSPQEAEREIGMVVEGFSTAHVLRDRSREVGVELPIVEAVCRVLDGASVADQVSTLMAREPTYE